MKLPVVSARQSRHSERLDTNSMSDTVATSFFDTRILRTDASPFPTIKNWKELAKGTLRALIREAGLTVDEFARFL